VASDRHPEEDRILVLAADEVGVLARLQTPGEQPVTARERFHVRDCSFCAGRVSETRRTLLTLELTAAAVSDQEAESIWESARRECGFAASSATTGDGAPVLSEQGRADRPRGFRALAGRLGDLFATLVPDGPLESAAVRGTALLPRLLVYETDDHTISLALNPRGERVEIAGSVTPKGAGELPAGGRATVYGETGECSAHLNDHGEFLIPGIPRSDLHLELELGDTRVQVSPIHAAGSGGPGPLGS
jgi:hypothetical protein